MYLRKPEGDMWHLVDIFGKRKVVHGAFEVVALAEDNIVLQGRRGGLNGGTAPCKRSG
jgi:predicted RNA-binding protein